jgi:hypothetical protein
LAERHPELWRELSTKAWFIDSAVSKFVWRGAKDLHDSDLTVRINQLRSLYGIAFVAWLTIAVMMIVEYPR